MGASGGADAADESEARSPAHARVSIPEVVAIGVGGAVGTALRAAIAQLQPVTAGQWPWATFLANLVGAAILGATMTAVAQHRRRWPYWGPLIGTGLCGGVTTFSTMQVETVRLMQYGSSVLALLYSVLSVIAGLIAVQAASAVVRRSEEEAA
jgi:fluoride exporter